MKILFTSLLIVFGFTAFSKASLEPVYKRQPSYYTIKLLLEQGEKDWAYSLQFGSSDNAYQEPLSYNDAFLQLDTVKNLKSFFVSYDDSLYRKGYLNNIKRLHIVIRNTENNNVDLDLSELSILKQLSLDRVQHVLLTQEGRGMVHINLSSWPIYKQWKKKRQLRSFEIQSELELDFNIEDLKPFNRLEQLAVPQEIGNELKCFPKLRSLSARGVQWNFTHQITQLDQLTEFHEYSGLYRNQFETMHAERYFFLSTLPMAAEVEASMKRKVNTSALDVLIQEVKNALPARWTDNGEIFVLENELPSYCRGSVLNDTLLFGRTENGEPVGLWTFRLASQYKYNDPSAHHFDFDKKSRIKIPKNGSWKFEYANGATAIEGQFEKGQKQGVWSFYEEDGDLRSTKWFQNDTLLRNVVYQSVDNIVCQTRVYYFSPESCVQSFQSGDRASFNYMDLNASEIDPLVIQENAIGVLDENRRYKYTLKKSPNFGKVMRENVIDFLYPEFVDSELPFTF